MKKVYVVDLNGELCYVGINDFGEITDNVAFGIIFRNTYIVTDGRVTRRLIELIRYLLTAFAQGNMDPFIENISEDGIPYFRFSNDATFAMTFVPFDGNSECYLMTIMPAIEL